VCVCVCAICARAWVCVCVCVHCDDGGAPVPSAPCHLAAADHAPHAHGPHARVTPCTSHPARPPRPQVLALVEAAAPEFDERCISNCLHALAALELSGERALISRLLAAAEGVRLARFTPQVRVAARGCACWLAGCCRVPVCARVRACVCGVGARGRAQQPPPGGCCTPGRRPPPRTRRHTRHHATPRRASPPPPGRSPRCA
jgi:hypothetical protein